MGFHPFSQVGNDRWHMSISFLRGDILRCPREVLLLLIAQENRKHVLEAESRPEGFHELKLGSGRGL